MSKNHIELDKLWDPMWIPFFMHHGEYSDQTNVYISPKSDKSWVKLAFSLPNFRFNPEIISILTSSTFNWDIQEAYLESQMIGIFQSVFTIEKLMTKQLSPILILEKYLKYSASKNLGAFETSQKGALNKVKVLLKAVEDIGSLFGDKQANLIFDHLFNFPSLKSELLKLEKEGKKINIDGKSADQWFSENWRLFTMDYNDLSIEQQKNVDKFESLFSLCFTARIHKYKFLQPKQTHFKFNLHKFVKDMIKIGELYLNIPKFSSYPVSDPMNHKYDRYPYGVISDILTTMFNDLFGNGILSNDAVFDSETVSVLSKNRIRAIKQDNGLRFHEILMLETMTKYLIDLIFNGDIESYNAFNSKLSSNDVSLDMQLWSDTVSDSLDYHEVYFVKDSFSENYAQRIFYQGTRIGSSLYSLQVDALGNSISVNLKRGSFDEGIIALRNQFYYDEDGNIRIVIQNMRRDTMSLQDISSQRKHMVRRKAPDNSYNKHNDLDGIKDMYGDYIRFLGHMYGKDALRALYIENAGMKKASYFAYKIFDILGLRGDNGIPTECIVPDGQITDDNRIFFNSIDDYLMLLPPKHFDAYGNVISTRYYQDGIPVGCTYLQLYRDIIQSGNKHIQGREDWAKGELDGEFSPLFDHRMSNALSRARLIAAERGLNFESYQKFIESFYLMEFGEDGNPLDFRLCLGLNEEMAKNLVAAYGLTWGSPGVYLSGIEDAVAKWWEDFGKSTESVIAAQDGIPINNQWAAFSFLSMYKYMTEVDSSWQVYLLFSPDLLFGVGGIWEGKDYSNIAEMQGDHLVWLDPASTPENHLPNFGEYANFDSMFDMLYYNSWIFMGLEIPNHLLPNDSNKDKWYVNINHIESLAFLLDIIALEHGIE